MNTLIRMNFPRKIFNACIVRIKENSLLIIKNVLLKLLLKLSNHLSRSLYPNELKLFQIYDRFGIFIKRIYCNRALKLFVFPISRWWHNTLQIQTIYGWIILISHTFNKTFYSFVKCAILSHTEIVNPENIKI